MPHPINNEQELVYLITQGDELAFAKLFHLYRDKVYGIALKLTRSATVAEEIVQDVFLKIWLRRTALHEVENLGAYLFTIARNETYRILKEIAKNYNLILLAESPDLPAHNNAEDQLAEKEHTSLLQNAISRLPRQQKHVYKLMKEEDLKRGEVARLLQLRPETVKFHLAQAMKNIRAYCMPHLDIFIGFTILFSTFF